MSHQTVEGSRPVVAVAGAGVGGLAAAIRMAIAGYAVHVYEQGAGPGGKLGERHLGGYRFDTGPSLLTMPETIRELFALAGERLEDHLTLEPLREVTRYHFDSGKTVTAPSDPEALAAVLARELGESEVGIRQYLHEAARRMRLAGGIFLDHPLQRWATYRQQGIGRAIAALPTMGLLGSLSRYNARTFRSAEARQLFDRFATYNGSDPHRLPALYSMIASVEHGQGAWYPRGGMHQIARALEGLAVRLGVQFVYGTPVTRIETDGATRQVRAIHLGGAREGARVPVTALVSNLDVHRLYGLLPEALPRPARTLGAPMSMSAIVFYWGMAGAAEEPTLAGLGLHNLFFSPDYKEEFAAIRQGRVPTHPSVYVNITSTHTPGDAPPGGQNWFVMINLPARAGWGSDPADGLIDEARERVLTRLTRYLGPGLAARIEAEAVRTPAELEATTGARAGALYGPSAEGLLSGFWRHPNAHPRLSNLFMTGGTVHPGGGIPLALKSARIAATLAQERLGPGPGRPVQSRPMEAPTP